MKKIILLLSILLSQAALAQTPVYQSGVVTPGDPAMWTAQRFIGDATLNGGFTNWLMTSATPTFCINDALTTNAYHQLCLGANSSSNAGYFSYGAVNGASSQPLIISVNGGTMTINGSTLSLGASGTVLGSLSLYDGGGLNLQGALGGTVTVTGAPTSFTPWTLQLPVSQGTVNGPVLSEGAGVPWSYGTASGGSSSSYFLTGTGSYTNNNCPKISVSGGQVNFIDSGATCASSGVGAGTAGNIPYYAVTGSAIAANTNLNISNAALTIGVAGTSQGSVALTGAGSGFVALAVPSSNTSYTITLPNAVPAQGQVLEASNGSGSTAWAYPSLGYNDNITSSQAASTGNAYCMNDASGSLTLTLPSAPTNGSVVGVSDCGGLAGNFGVNPLTIARNGSNIMYTAANMTVSTPYANFTMRYSSGQTSWILSP